MCPSMLCCSLWEFGLKALRCSPTDSGGTSQVVGQGHTSSSSPPWWHSILPVGFSWLVCCVYLIKVQPLQLFWNSRHVFILISECCQQVFPQKCPYWTIPSSAIVCRHLLLCSEVESSGQKVLREQPCQCISTYFSLECCLCLIILHRKCWCSPPSNHPCIVLLLCCSSSNLLYFPWTWRNFSPLVVHEQQSVHVWGEDEDGELLYLM